MMREIKKTVRSELIIRLGILQGLALGGLNPTYEIFGELDPRDIDDQEVAREIYTATLYDNPAELAKTFHKRFPDLFGRIMLNMEQTYLTTEIDCT